MNQEQKQKIKTKILQDIEDIEKTIEALAEFTKPIAPDCALGCQLRDEMIVEQEVSATTLQQSEIKLNKLKYALSKIDKDDYGVCKECDEEILVGRLMIIPESLYCVPCQSELSGL
ncbi:MAG: TraR/DksA C4-type zinc finger protein [Campylobacterota bacterium]|nr:TraR/DksA C4-type zinc finger protein [Campylobacterota bacterium]